jgi:hypothetical protein
MPPSKTSFVTGCQQILALGVVLAALAPATSVVSLDIVRQTPRGTAPVTVQGDLAAYTRVAHRPARVPTEVVDPVMREVSLTAPAGAHARGKVGALPKVVTSAPEPVTGFGAVGVTWAHGTVVPETGIAFDVRTRTDDTWSD